MVNFATVEVPIVKQNSRINQQKILPTAVKPAQLAQTTAGNTQAEILGPYTVGNNASLSVLSIIQNAVNNKFRLGAMPYNIVFFEDTLDIGSIIGSGVTGDYIINGPMGIPQFIPYATTGSIGGNDGNDVVFLTEIINKSGISHDLYAITDTRFFNPIGGASDQS